MALTIHTIIQKTLLVALIPIKYSVFASLSFSLPFSICSFHYLLSHLLIHSKAASFTTMWLPLQLILLALLLLLLSRFSPTLCDPIGGSPPGSAIPGILQARTLEWVAISVSNAWKWKVKVKSESEVAQSCLTLRHPMDCSLPGSSVHGIFQARVLEWGAIAFSC